LERLLKIYLSFVDGHPDEAKIIMWGLLRFMGREDVPLVGVWRDRTVPMERMVVEGIDSGEFGKVDASLLSYFFIALALTYLLANIGADRFPDVGFKSYDKGEFLRFFDQTVLEGLRCRGKPS